MEVAAHQLVWRKGVFDSNYQLYDNGDIKGSLIFSSSKNNARGIASKNYYFTSEGYLNPLTKIRDEHHQEIGIIHYELWKLKASVVFSDQSHAFWSYTNGRLSQWSITHHTRQIHYYSSTGAGTIKYDEENEILMLTGIFIREFFSRLIILLLAIIIIPLILQQL